MHTSHVCVTLTSRLYFLPTLAQGKKAAPGWKGTSVVTSVLGWVLLGLHLFVGTLELPNFRMLLLLLLLFRWTAVTSASHGLSFCIRAVTPQRHPGINACQAAKTHVSWICFLSLLSEKLSLGGFVLNGSKHTYVTNAWNTRVNAQGSMLTLGCITRQSTCASQEKRNPDMLKPWGDCCLDHFAVFSRKHHNMYNLVHV